MSRRTLTLLLASVLALVLTGGAVQTPVPYVALGPGPTYNTIGEIDGEPLLVVEGRPTYPTDGHLDLTTVGVQPELTLVEALQGWFDRDLAVVPRDLIYPPGKSDDEVDQQNAEWMTASQTSATTAAARQLGLRTAEVRVQEVPEGSPSEGLLQEGDILTTVDGERVRDAAELRGLIGQREVGEVVRIGFERDGEPGVVDVTTGSAGAGAEDSPVIGVVTEELPIEAPFDVEITLDDVGGPSAGLMFSLAILELLSEESLTGGLYIAGTGEITRDGTVRPIGGISQKLIAAKAKGADAFLVPEANCAEAVVSAPDDLPLLRVGSLGQALAGLEALRNGEDPALCPTA